MTRHYGRQRAPPRHGSGRLVLVEAVFLACALAGALALARMVRAPETSQVATRGAEPTRATRLSTLDQTTVPPTRGPELPSLTAEPVVAALALDAALNAGDVEATMGLFDAAAQVKVPPDVYTGTTQIRTWVSYLAANHFAAEPGLRHLSGDTVTWPAEVRSDQLVRFGLASLDGEATLVVHGGKIMAYTFVLSRESAGQLRARQVAASEVLQDPLLVGENNANVYGADDVFRTADGTLMGYRELIGAEPGSGPFYDLGGQPIVLRTGL